MIYIISGPTSAGKSTFMASERAAELTGLPAETPAEKPEPWPEEEPAGPLDAAPEPPKPEFRPDKPPPSQHRFTIPVVR